LAAFELQTAGGLKYVSLEWDVAPPLKRIFMKYYFREQQQWLEIKGHGVRN